MHFFDNMVSRFGGGAEAGMFSLDCGLFDEIKAIREAMKLASLTKKEDWLDSLYQKQIGLIIGKVNRVDESGKLIKGFWGAKESGMVTDLITGIL